MNTIKNLSKILSINTTFWKDWFFFQIREKPESMQLSNKRKWKTSNTIKKSNNKLICNYYWYQRWSFFFNILAICYWFAVCSSFLKKQWTTDSPTLALKAKFYQKKTQPIKLERILTSIFDLHQIFEISLKSELCYHAH